MAGIEIVTNEGLYACFCNPTAKMEKDREEEIFLRVIENMVHRKTAGSIFVPVRRGREKEHVVTVKTRGIESLIIIHLWLKVVKLELAV